MTTLDQSSLILGVPEMDRDHRALDALFDSAGEVADDDLSILLDRIALQLKAHFRREEKLMAAGQVPLVECHRAQHQMILQEVARVQNVAPHAEARALRRLMATVLPQMINSHVASVDRLAAAFLTGKLEEANFQGLRLPVASPKP